MIKDHCCLVRARARAHTHTRRYNSNKDLLKKKPKPLRVVQRSRVQLWSRCPFSSHNLFPPRVLPTSCYTVTTSWQIYTKKFEDTNLNTKVTEQAFVKTSFHICRASSRFHKPLQSETVQSVFRNLSITSSCVISCNCLSIIWWATKITAIYFFKKWLLILYNFTKFKLCPYVVFS